MGVAGPDFPSIFWAHLWSIKRQRLTAVDHQLQQFPPHPSLTGDEHYVDRLTWYSGRYHYLGYALPHGKGPSCSDAYLHIHAHSCESIRVDHGLGKGLTASQVEEFGWNLYLRSNPRPSLSLSKSIQSWSPHTQVR